MRSLIAGLSTIRRWLAGDLMRVAVVAWLGPFSCCAAADVAAPITCTLLSAALDFGNLAPQRKSEFPGVGEIVVACHNHSQTAVSAEMTVAFPTMGANSAPLRAKQDTLLVNFFRDAQWTEGWGNDRNGAASLRVMLDLTAGEQRRLRLPVYALLRAKRQSAAGVYLTQIPVEVSVRVP